MELTATGIVTDSHRIPFSPLATLGYKTCNTRLQNSQRSISKTRNARLQNSQRPTQKLVTLGAQTHNTRSVKAPYALQM